MDRRKVAVSDHVSRIASSIALVAVVFAFIVIGLLAACNFIDPETSGEVLKFFGLDSSGATAPGSGR